ncbi:MAG: AraC family transcriptional regulator [Reichenbachiella sp.]|uniref:helix-turn-helix domain-containing protein n=1 Tax=Reichenbachiella sp. TaxID=2184521 RepID=UPI00329A4E08
MSITIFDIIIIFGALQGVFVGLLLPSIADGNKKANHVLSFLLFMMSVMLLGRLMFFNFPRLWMYQITLIPDVIIYLFGPFLWLYTFRLVHSSIDLPKHFFWHFIPAIVYMISVVYYFQFSSEEYTQMASQGELQTYFRICVGTAIALNISYLGASIRLLYLYKQKLSRRFSNYLSILLGLIGIILAVWLTVFVFRPYFPDLPVYDYTWVAISMVSVFVGYNAISRPEIFRKLKIGTANKELLASDEIGELSQQLDDLMMKHALYREPDLTLKKVSDKLKISSNKLSWLLNKVYHSSFYDFINGYRVEDVLNRISNQEHEFKTLLGIAFEAGFNSKTTFNKAFKEKVGRTPSAYLKRQFLKTSEVN